MSALQPEGPAHAKESDIGSVRTVQPIEAPEVRRDSGVYRS